VRSPCCRPGQTLEQGAMAELMARDVLQGTENNPDCRRLRRV